MPPRKTTTAPADKPKARLEDQGGILVLAEPVYHYRVLIDDGTLLDVRATHDGSVLRDAVLAHVGVKDAKIAGVTTGAFVGWTQHGEQPPPKRRAPNRTRDPG